MLNRLAFVVGVMAVEILLLLAGGWRDSLPERGRSQELILRIRDIVDGCKALLGVVVDLIILIMIL